ncbi:uncharacterized protein F4812DRAFT_100810 [Daldinia caldariorum]|uniref:uncharacterized protein n=1 Tax=Daldinia caldariorum TaxID=326644 RepID=UPI002007AACF|nr:uncharacterized protein F4812DRAFT_100810 [Daldinia caldariorum]KAI1466236.1 hypothetical protein F4812DRAFT_100810 [Daldinia caldariorum]
MAEGMRLRLVVRRDGLPEERLMWNVSLEDDPTISKLVEKVNETFPLEIGRRGLEDYVVELRDQDGASFECLHFQPVRTVLKPDDRVFIRPLDRDDNRRRRISGRHQISSDGRHLVDGIPFGRRLLRAPISRPPIDPPRKRRKLLHPYDNLEDDVNDDEEEDTPMLLLTNGERPSHKSSFPSVKFSPKVDTIDAEAEDGDFDDGTGQEDSSGGSESEDSDQQDAELPSDEDDLEQELRDLAEDNAAVEGKEPSEVQTLAGEGHNKVSKLQAAFPSAPASICEQVLATSGNDLKSAYDVLIDGFAPQLSESALLAGSMSTGTTRKPKSQKKGLKNKFPTTSLAEERVDDIMDDDESVSEEEGEEEEGEQISSFVRQFDHRGLPPGSITSGRGLVQMAAISSSVNGDKVNSERKPISVASNGHKTSPGKMAEEDDTSSDATSSSSESEELEVTSDSDSDDDDSNNNDSDDGDTSSNGSDDRDNESDKSDSDDSSMHQGNSSPGDFRGDRSNDSDNEDDNNSEDDDDSDDGPEEISIKPQHTKNQKPKQKRGLGYENDMNQTKSSSETSDDSDMSSEEDSDEEGSSSTSGSEEVETISNDIKATKAAGRTTYTGGPQIQPSKPIPGAIPEAQPVPPGAGSERTRKRNARRRAANKAKKLAQQGSILSVTPTGEETRSPITDEKALIEAKRQELLKAIANGGVEVGPPTRFDEPSKTSTSVKRKLDEHDEDTLVTTPMDESANSSGSVQKKARLDIGAGRRLVFGALGLRNPRTKADENELRAKLMKDLRPLDNPRLDQSIENTEVNEDTSIVEESSESWKDKIIYRAVECCHEGVQLSEPPFPFVQRWDPQQQGSWSQKKNKRGGQSKRAQRNQAHFYQDTRPGKKQKHDESDMWDEDGYDDTFNGVNDYTNDADIELNYDDTESYKPQGTNEPTNNASQFTDFDDLPSLPSDLSTLPPLRPGEVKVGMVITWQQWSCSSATSWQPQLSNVTGVVVGIDDDATGLEVCLAKRDRYLDRNQKKYDENTGQRIYDKFEAPDLDDEDDDDGEDEGFRIIGFAEMQQPRILQQPLSAMVTNENPDAVGLLPKASTNTGSKPPATDEDAKANAHSEQEPSSTKEPTEENESRVVPIENSSPNHEHQHSSILTSDDSQINSPSQQLRENASQSVGIQPNHLPVQDVSHRNSDLNEPLSKPDIEVPGSELPSIRHSSAPLFDSHEDEVVIGTPKVVKSKAIVPPSSASSARSGRQLDYSLDMEVTEPDSLKITDDGLSTSLDNEYQQDLESDEEVSTPTPTPTPFLHDELTVEQERSPQKAEASSPANISTPSSLTSINTIWCTAQTSLNTQSPSKSQSQSLPTNGSQQAQAQDDQDFEETIRKLDNTSDDQASSSKVPDSFERRSQGRVLEDVKDFRIFKRLSTSPPIKISPPPARRRKLPKESSQFTLPPGTQVIELSSDSEPVYAENYADDEVDETYSPDPDSLPRGSGWVHKADTKGRNARSVTAPIRPQPPKRKRFISSSQGPMSTSSSASVSAIQSD